MYPHYDTVENHYMHRNVMKILRKLRNHCILGSILIRILFHERLILKCLFIIETLERHVIFELLFNLPGFFYISKKCALCNQFLFETTSQCIFEIVIPRDSVRYALMSVAFGG